MKVVSNTSPLSYLLTIGEVGILPQLFEQVWVPGVVLVELGASGSAEAIRRWAQAPPPWVQTKAPLKPETGFALHIGEDQAVSLAVELKAGRLLMDDRAGREAARSLGVEVLGTIGVLDLAAERGLLDLPTAMKRLCATNFRIAASVVEEVLRRDADRKRQG